MLSRSLLRRARSGRVPNVRPLPISLSSHPTPLVHSTSFPSIPTSFMSTSTDDFSDYDNIRQTDRIQKENGDPSKREFTYLMVGSLRFVYASAIRLGVMKFIASMSASDDVLAVANLEVPVAGIDEGTFFISLSFFLFLRDGAKIWNRLHGTVDSQFRNFFLLILLSFFLFIS